MQFKPPGEQARRRAIGPLDQLSANIRKLLDPTGFDPIPAPGPMDWLSAFSERGQTFEQFLNSHPNFPDQIRRRIYLLPLETFPADAPSLAKLKAFTEAFFSMPVTLLPVAPHGLGKITTRVNTSTHKIQLLTGDILTLLQPKIPPDGYCLLAITLRDLYPEPSWNFVFGQASLDQRVGVYSFARYDPRFEGEDRPDRAGLMLRRCCRVLAHETGHMFGIQHCIYFHCVMNGSNTLPEDDSQPLHVCPVDLRKLYTSIKFDPVARYAHLCDFFREAGFTDEADWTEKQLHKITAAG